MAVLIVSAMSCTLTPLAAAFSRSGSTCTSVTPSRKSVSMSVIMLLAANRFVISATFSFSTP